MRWWDRARPVVPIALVTTFAAYGQMQFAAEHLDGGPLGGARWIVAAGAAVTVESISLYVQWHAHDALVLSATRTAARLRRASYLIAGLVATINYSHFSAGWRPTAAAVMFALFSASSPWLWGLHTRRVQRMQLLREGHVDQAGAIFSAERLRAFPIRTWLAHRWSIDHGIRDPQLAWEGYNADRQAAKAARQAEEKAIEQSRTQLATQPRPELTDGHTDSPNPAQPDPENAPSPDPDVLLKLRVAQIRDRYQGGAINTAQAVAQLADAHIRVGRPKPSRRATARALGHDPDHSATRKAWEALS